MKKLLSKLKFWRSLRAHIFIIVFIMGLLPCLIVRHVIVNNYESRAVSVRTSDVSNQLKIIADHLITYNYFTDGASAVIDAELNQLSNLYDGRVLIINQDLVVIKDTYDISTGKTIISEEVIKGLQNQSFSTYDSNNKYIELIIPIVATMTDKDSSAENVQTVVKGVMLTSVSADTIITTMDILSHNAALLIAIMLCVILVLSFFLSKILDMPFDKLTKAISEVKEGYSNDPLEVDDYVETEHICAAFNELQKRMKVLDDSRQEFVSNVSHELKTPITSMKVLADSLVGQQNVPEELYQEFMQDITNEIDRESKIINDLLSLVKMDKTASDISIKQVDMNELVGQVLKRLSPIADKEGVELYYESVRPVTASVDDVKISLVISNLVENAIKYNKPNGWVRVNLDADHQFFTLTVSDNGIGIPEESMNQIFERFYRVDKSHSREIGGTGLGLAITKNAVLMHRGSIKVESVVTEGTTFIVKIPLTYISN